MLHNTGYTIEFQPMFRLSLFTVCLLAFVNVLGQNSPLSPKPNVGQTSHSASREPSASKSESPDSMELEAIDTPEPEYPDAARKRNIQGDVAAMILVSESGDVENVQTLSGDPALTSAAVEALRRWKFKPYIKSGQPVAAVAKVTFTFRPQDDSEKKATVTSAISNTSVMPSVVRVSQGVTQGLILKEVAPEYPEPARKARVQGSVVMAGTISKDGTVKDLQVLSGPPELMDAAVDAVRQWVYRPYLLMGRAVQVNTQFTVNFTLTRR